MSTIREQLNWQYRWLAGQAGKFVMIEEALKELGILETETDYDTPYLSPYGDQPSITLKPRHVLGVLTDVEVGDTALARAAKVLLPKVGSWDKGFDSSTNEITLTGTVKGVKVILKGATPATCTVETVDEDVEIPASKYKRVKYRLVGDCDPVMAVESVQQEENPF